LGAIVSTSSSDNSESLINILHNRDGGTYRGQWHYHETRKRWEGNPASSAEVADVLTAIKHKSGAEGGDRTHSLAMAKEYMERILKWSEGKVSVEAVQNVLKNAGQTSVTVEERALMTKHLQFRAFASTAWTVWSRCVDFFACLVSAAMPSLWWL
jgi:hypothetical protein